MKSTCLAAIVLISMIKGNTQTITRTATLTPEQPSNNGASISAQNIDSIANNEWFVEVEKWDHIGWHWLISFDDEWKFKSHTISTITLTVNSSSNVSSDTDRDIVFSWSQNNSYYFSTYFNLDNKATNRIYPQCDQANETHLFADGDIDYLYNRDITDLYDPPIWGRYYRTLGGLNEKGDVNIFSIQPVIGLYNNFPLIIKLINNPIEGWSRWQYTNPYVAPWKQSCVFQPFSSNYTLDIYISAGNGNTEGEKLKISSFQLQFEYDATVAPTNNPTTRIPTEDTLSTATYTDTSSFNPTSAPDPDAVSTVYNQSVSTNNPTTRIPTEDTLPTATYTDASSFNPTSASNLDAVPTVHNQSVSTINMISTSKANYSEIYRTEQDEESKNKVFIKWNGSMLTIALIGIIAVLICIVVCSCWRQRQLRREVQALKAFSNKTMNTKSMNEQLHIMRMPLELDDIHNEAAHEGHNAHKKQSKTHGFIEDVNDNVDNVNNTDTRKNTVEWLQKAVLVEEWLKEIGMSQYYEVFTSNGYDSLPIIKEIATKSLLQEIGICYAPHQRIILSEMRKLQNANNNNNNNGLIMDNNNGGELFEIGQRTIEGEADKDNTTFGDSSSSGVIITE